MAIDGHVEKLLPSLTPKGPKTGFAQTGCYLSADCNCSSGLTGEHYISKSVLVGLGDTIEITGMPWLAEGTNQRVTVKSLTAKVLCKRHNNVLSPLDEEAGQFAACLKETHKNLSSGSLSRRTAVALFSGEAIELWLLKVACGVCTSFATKDGVKVTKDYTLDFGKVHRAFMERRWDNKAGLYLRSMVGTGVVGRSSVSVTPLFSEDRHAIVGARAWIYGMEFDLLFDMTGIEPHSECAHRPSVIEFRNERRSRFIVLTWPRGTPPWVVQLTAGSRVTNA